LLVLHFVDSGTCLIKGLAFLDELNSEFCPWVVCPGGAIFGVVAKNSFYARNIASDLPHCAIIRQI